MKHFQIVESLAKEASGPSYSVLRLAQSMVKGGSECEIFCLEGPGGFGREAKLNIKEFSRDFPRVPFISKLGFSKSFAAGLIDSFSPGSVFHVHGLWRMVNVYPGRLASKKGAPLILSPRGMLGGAALNFSAYQKQLFWLLAQRRALSSVSCYHATSGQEVEDIRSMGLYRPIAVIPNGIDVPELRRFSRPSGSRTALFLSRVHPKKGVDQLLRAWARVESEFPDWRLKIVGPSEKGHIKDLQSLSLRLALRRVSFSGPLYGVDKEVAYASAELFILPTLHENFGLVVAEALSNATPVICTKGAPWEGLRTNGCGWWVDHGVEAMEAALRRALACETEELLQMGLRGRSWMAREFGWDGIAARMLEVYAWCLGTGGRPNCVVTD